MKKKSRAARAAEIAEKLRSAGSEVETLRDEIENWSSGMEGTNLENTSKYEALGECRDALEDAMSTLDGVVEELEAIEFPTWRS